MLLNLGTPDSPGRADVRRYLEEFLMDPRVLDIPFLKRWLVVHGLILPRRPKTTGSAYEKVWTERGSPLLFHGVDLVRKVSELVGDEVRVELAMRYQSPSIASVLDSFRRQEISQIAVFPLFPQYSSAATGSAIEKVFAEAAKRWNVPSIHIVPPFYEHPAFLDAFADVSRPVLDDAKPERIVMSFHGLPERHMRKSDESTGSPHCLATDDCCEAICAANRNCYRAQCFATARGIASRLRLDDGAWEVTFQSRLGRDPWIRPYTDVRIDELAASGVKRVAVLCPAFVADCLETLEEIGMRAKGDFLERGGEDLRLVPSLNSEDSRVKAVGQIVRQTTGMGGLDGRAG
jgi:ferrochelatase